MGRGGINNSSQVVNQPDPTTICHMLKMSAHLIKSTVVRTVNRRAICQPVCSETVRLINEMNEESKDSQEEVRELLGVYVRSICQTVTVF